MVAKLRGGVRAGEKLTGNMDFFVIKTLVPMAEGDVDTDATTGADNLERLTQVFEMRSQPVLISTSSETVANPAGAGFGSSFTSSATVYTIKFANEHTGQWVATTGGNNSLVDALHGLAMPYGGSALDLKTAATINTIVTASLVL
jgi:phytoene dehydrogenase-like protein